MAADLFAAVSTFPGTIGEAFSGWRLWLLSFFALGLVRGGSDVEDQPSRLNPVNGCVRAFPGRR